MRQQGYIVGPTYGQGAGSGESAHISHTYSRKSSERAYTLGGRPYRGEGWGGGYRIGKHRTESKAE